MSALNSSGTSRRTLAQTETQKLGPAELPALCNHKWMTESHYLHSENPVQNCQNKIHIVQYQNGTAR